VHRLILPFTLNEKQWVSILGNDEINFPAVYITEASKIEFSTTRDCKTVSWLWNRQI